MHQYEALSPPEKLSELDRLTMLMYNAQDYLAAIVASRSELINSIKADIPEQRNGSGSDPPE